MGLLPSGGSQAGDSLGGGGGCVCVCDWDGSVSKQSSHLEIPTFLCSRESRGGDPGPVGALGIGMRQGQGW